MSKNTGTSELINYFDLGANGDVGIAGSLDVNTIANATTDTDKFLVSDTGIIKYRTGAELLSDIGGQGLLTNPVTGTGLVGQVAYWASGSAITGESNLFWDATNDRLGIGLNNPSQILHIQKDQNYTTTLLLQNTADGSGAATEIRLFGNEGVSPLKNGQQISFVRGSGGVDWAIGQPADSNDFVFSGGTNQGDGKPSLGTAERMRITSGGNVGIGTTSPSGAAGLALALNSGANQCRIALKTSATGDGSGAGLQFVMSGIDAGIEQRENASLDLATNGIGRMRITAEGNVGIGTTNPSKKLEIFDNNNSTDTITGLRIINYSSTANARAGIVFQSYDNNGAAIWSNRTGTTTGELIFGTNGGAGIAETNIAERMRIYSDGVVTTKTIQLNDPTYFASNFYGIRLVGVDNGSNGTNFQIQGRTTPTGVFSTLLTITNTGATTVLGNVYSSGNLASATGNQSANTISANLFLGNRGYFSDQTIGAAQISAISTGTFWYSGTAMAFYTNPGPDVTGTANVERMRITSGGNVGIGTASPASLLNLKSSTTTELRLESVGGTYRSFIGFRTDGQKWDLGVNLNDLQDALSFNYSGSERMRITSGGNVLIGTTTDAGVKLDVLGTARISGNSTYAEFSLKDNTASGSNWFLLSGFPSLGDFTIREAGVANHLVIKKTSGNVLIPGNIQFNSILPTSITISLSGITAGSWFNIPEFNFNGFSGLVTVNIINLNSEYGYFTESSAWIFQAGANNDPSYFDLRGVTIRPDGTSQEGYNVVESYHTAPNSGRYNMRMRLRPRNAGLGPANPINLQIWVDHTVGITAGTPTLRLKRI